MNMGYKYQADIWKLLRHNIAKGQIIGFVVANIVGLSVILIGIMFFCDSQHNNEEKDNFLLKDYLVISKKVEGIGFAPTSFSEKEIKSLSEEKWVKKIGRFSSSQFAVYGNIGMGGKSISSYLFFESVPDEFFDIMPKEWDFSPEKKYVPIILCKDYLTLYNFGFAIPQGLPQVSEEIIGTIPITLRLTGEGMHSEYFDANVVGFSSRLNTIAVPQRFMDWANERYSNNEEKEASRLIIEVDRQLASGMNEYFTKHNIEVAGDKEQAGKLSTFLGVVSVVVTGNGIVISILAMFILVLSIFLLMQKSQEKLRNLMLLGYSPQYISRYYESMVVIINVSTTALSLIIMFVARSFWTDGLTAIGLGSSPVYPTMAVAVIYLICATTLDIYIIRSRMKNIWEKA